MLGAARRHRRRRHWASSRGDFLVCNGNATVRMSLKGRRLNHPGTTGLTARTGLRSAPTGVALIPTGDEMPRARQMIATGKHESQAALTRLSRRDDAAFIATTEPPPGRYTPPGPSPDRLGQAASSRHPHRPRDRTRSAAGCQLVARRDEDRRLRRPDPNRRWRDRTRPESRQPPPGDVPNHPISKRIIRPTAAVTRP